MKDNEERDKAIAEFDELMNNVTEEELEKISEEEAYKKFGYSWFKAHATQCMADAVFLAFIERIPHKHINLWIRRYVTESNDKMIEDMCK